MAKLTGKVLIAQGGGPTAVINQSLVGAVLESRKFPEVTRVYGATNGVRGIVNEDFLDLTQETTHNLEQVAMTPSSALLSTRDKPDEAYCREIFKVCQAHDVRYFFYIGGNDSADTVRIVNSNAETAGYDMRCIHIPKTVDNDLVVNDHTPGLRLRGALRGAGLHGLQPGQPGAARACSSAWSWAATRASSPPPRPWAASTRTTARTTSTCPSGPSPRSSSSRDVKAAMEKHGRCLVAVSEGVLDKDGKPFMTKLSGSKEADAHGNVQLSGSGALGDMLSDLVKEKLKIKRVRADTLGYAQRSYLGVVSDVDAHEAREVGEKAAQFAIWHDHRRLHHHPAHGQLLRGLPHRAAGGDRGQDQDHAEGVPHRGGQRHDVGLLQLRAAAARARVSPTCTASARRRWRRY